MYTNFAYVYDKLMYDVDYPKWADFIEEIFKMNGLKPKLMLDLGCGTGSFTIEMAKRGYDMIGVDLSADMLACAKTKSVEAGMEILYLTQNMTDFELYGTVDAIICLLDSVNYVIKANELKRMFKLVNNYLNPGGLFIFDINTEYKLANVLGDNVFYDINDNASYIWKNYYDKRKKLCEFDLTFFVKEGQYYKKYDELHYERAYSIKEIKSYLTLGGLDIVTIYDDLRFKKPNSKSSRVFFVCKKANC